VEEVGRAAVLPIAPIALPEGSRHQEYEPGFGRQRHGESEKVRGIRQVVEATIDPEKHPYPSPRDLRQCADLVEKEEKGLVPVKDMVIPERVEMGAPLQASGQAAEL